MKNPGLFAAFLLCILSMHVSAQVKAPLNEPLADKPMLFSSLPEKFIVNTLTIEKIFTGSSTGQVKIPIENNRMLEGRITERLQRNANLVTVNIILPDYGNALFTISRFLEKDGSVSCSGRIVNVHYGDVLVLKEESQQLYLVKEKQSLFLVE